MILLLLLLVIAVLVFYPSFQVLSYFEREKKLNSLLTILIDLNLSPSHSKPKTFYLLESSYSNYIMQLEYSILLALVRQVVDDHSVVLLRKRKTTLVTDDYGKQRRDKWDAELTYFVTQVFYTDVAEKMASNAFSLEKLSKASLVESPENTADWCCYVDDVLDLNEAQQKNTFLYSDVMTGYDYEHYVCELMISLGWSARVTGGSGDHGADVLASKHGTRVVIQCKFFSSAVGNKAVQEVYSAKGYYDCDYAAVVTNNTYTRAARELATKVDVDLLHHEDLIAWTARF